MSNSSSSNRSSSNRSSSDRSPDSSPPPVDLIVAVAATGATDPTAATRFARGCDELVGVECRIIVQSDWVAAARSIAADAAAARVLVVPPGADLSSVRPAAHRGPGPHDVAADIPTWWSDQVTRVGPATAAAVAFRGVSLPRELLAGARVAAPVDDRAPELLTAELIEAAGGEVSPLAAGTGAPWTRDDAARLAGIAVDMAAAHPRTRTATGLGSSRRVAYGRLTRRRVLVRFGALTRRAGRSADATLEATFWRVVSDMTAGADPALRPGVPILMYHAFDEKDRARYVVARRSLRRQLLALRLLRREVISLDDYVAARTEHRPTPRRAVVLTIDDGYADTYDVAAAELAAQGMTATLFVPSAHVGASCDWSQDPSLAGRPLASWAQLRDGTDVIAIGSHSTRHDALTELPTDEVADRLARSAHDLERGIGSPVGTFAYPYGARDTRTDDVAAASGYRAVCTSIGGLNLADEPLHRLRRIEVRGDRNTIWFAAAVLTGISRWTRRAGTA